MTDHDCEKMGATMAAKMAGTTAATKWLRDGCETMAATTAEADEFKR